MRFLAPTLCALALASCTTLPPAEAGWPTLGEGPQLAPDTVITHFAFGSCNSQDHTQAIWSSIAASHPQAFIAMGDNIYGETGEGEGPVMPTLVEGYRTQMTSAPFMQLRREVPMMVTWDDNDYGKNDGGASFELRETSEGLFEHFWHMPAEVRGRPGLYQSTTIGPAGRRVQFIVLDTRFFRSDFLRWGPETPSGRYTVNTDPDATMLGAAQWDWLEQELAEPADLRVVVSSVQVLSEAHGWEAWDKLPLERTRLLDMLTSRAGGGLVLLTGDRHAAAFYETEWQGERITEFTASALNRPRPGGTEQATAREPDPLRLTPFIGEANFGSMVIDWSQRKLAMAIVAADGTPVETLVRSF
ncbi:alkaline phosphatase D family protein [Aurantiacibacter gilvus]|uniref:Alkaline phosphatase D family protein n=1 Tax=Aurantiacibacter gilvus TaxID=3139141 RepID=A0ABU9IBA9_9SPHN